MYTICHIIYGYPITQKINDELDRLELDPESGWFEGGGECGFELIYSGVGHIRCGFVGVELDSFDAIPTIYHRLDDINLTPTAIEKETAEERIASLLPSLRKLVGDPGIYIVFSTS